MKMMRPLSGVPTAAILSALQSYGILGFSMGFILGLSLFAIPMTRELGVELPWFYFIGVPVLLAFIVGIEIYLRRVVMPELRRRCRAAD